VFINLNYAKSANYSLDWLILVAACCVYEYQSPCKVVETIPVLKVDDITVKQINSSFNYLQ